MASPTRWTRVWVNSGSWWWTGRPAAAKSLQSCPTLCHPIDGSPLGSSVPGILQARTLEWVAISFSNAWKWKVKVKSLTHARLLVIPWTAAYQAPPSMGFFQARVLEWVAIAFSVCCSSWGRKESDTTEWVNWTELNKCERACTCVCVCVCVCVCRPGKLLSMLQCNVQERLIRAESRQCWDLSIWFECTPRNMNIMVSLCSAASTQKAHHHCL